MANSGFVLISVEELRDVISQEVLKAISMLPESKKVNEQETTICETKSNTQEKIIEILSAMTDLLLYKNEKYGDSALKPNNIFYKGDATNSILIRLDDKVGRIKNNPDIAVNDVCDIIGYCTLLLASMDVTEQEIEKLKD